MRTSIQHIAAGTIRWMRHLPGIGGLIAPLRLLPLLATILAFGAFTSPAAITFDAAASGGVTGGAGVTSVAWSHTVGLGANRMLVVGVTTESTTDSAATGVTFGTQVFTKVTGSRAVQGTPFNTTELWFLAAPRVGAGMITVTLSPAVSSGSGAACGSVSLFGVAQSAPEAVAIADAAGSGGTYSLGITTLTNGAWLVDVVNNGDGAVTFTPTASGMVERWEQGGSVNMMAACATREVAVAGLTTDTWTTTGTSRKAQSIAAFAPAIPGPPEIYISSPAASAMVSIANYTITAVAVDEGSVSKVRFFEDGILLGEDVTSPYSFIRPGAVAGPHQLTAVATDNNANTTTSAIINVTAADLPPTVSITSPANGSQATQGFPALIVASATDAEGPVTQVDFYDGAILLGSDTASPFQFSWSPGTLGNHTLSAVARDSAAASVTSAAVTVTVQSPISVGPTGSGTLTFETLAAARQWATLSVAGGTTEVVDAAGIDSVMNGIAAGNINTAISSQAGSGTAANAYWRSGDKKLGTQPNGNKVTLLMAPLRNTSSGTLDTLAVSYTLGLASVTPAEWIKGHRVYWSKTGSAGSWTAAGDYLLSTAGSTAGISIYLTALNWADGGSLYLVWADDNGTSPDGDYTIDNVSFTPFAGPVVSITSPANGATIGSDFTINAIAATGSGTISSVSFYDGPALLGTDNTSPYSYTWNAAAAGSHTLTAVANGTATSSAIDVTVAPGSGTLTRGPYLQKATPTTMTVRWRSTRSTLGRVRFGTDIADLNQTADESVIPVSPFDHVVTLTGLTPNTTYYYSAGSATDTLASGANYTFKTPPATGTSVNTRIWVLGDAGKANDDQRAVRDAFYNWTQANTPSLVLQLGDNAYNSGTDSEYQAAVFDIYPTMLSRTPFWSCIGNHETESAIINSPAYPYFDIYSLPTAGECGGVASGTEHYYSFDYGNIHFIALDSMTSSRAVDNPATAGINEDGSMAAWLRTDLASTTATWIICFFHHPPYSKRDHDSDSSTDSLGSLIQMRQNFLPILEAGGVDLVLSGHSHCYERSYLLDGHYGLSTTLVPAMKKNAGDGRPAGNGAYIKPLTGPRDHFGAVYAVAGSAGQVTCTSLNHPAHYFSLNNLGSLVLDVNGTRLDATFLRENSSTPDTFTIIKQGAADSDSDGIPDDYEIANGLNRHNAADAALDSDGDGDSNLREFIFATTPGIPDRYAFSTTYNSPAGTATVTFPTSIGRSYRVMYSHDLLSWQAGSAAATGTGAAMMWTDDGTVTGTLPNDSTKRFYRIEVTVVP